MSNKIKQIIDKLQQSNNLIQQQRKEIDKLKSMALSNIVNNYTTESEEEMTKPIAWMASNKLLFSVVKDEIYHIPLYTHPMRELTEDEIKEVADSVCHAWKKNGVGELYMTDFARAILKRASEK